MRRLAIALSLAVLWGPAVSNGQPEVGAARSDTAGDVAAARAVVESLHAVLLSCMKDGKQLGFQGRYDRIISNLDGTFDLPFMARVSVGGAWKELDEVQRSDFTALSRRYSASNYAKNFNGYGGESFETHADEPAAHGTIVVKTEFVQPTDDNVSFDYRLRNAGNGWRIIDVQLDGKVSELTLRRADYRSVIEREGFPHLVEEIEKKIEDFSSK